jgi:hypothetical protein
MSLKTINIEPEHLKVSSRKNKRKVPVLSINEPNLRQVLLNKLIQRRKTQKKALVLPVSEGGFDDVDKPVQAPIQPDVCPVVNPDKPYGVLKNGTKPTFKEWSLNKSLTPSAPLVETPCPSVIEKPLVNEIHSVIETASPLPVVETQCPSVEIPLVETEPTITKKIKVGKNKRTKSVDVLIENIHTRKLNKDKLQLLKKTNITTIKNYLKNRQFIKVGSNAPNSLIRYMYENIKECGDVVNENKSNLIHNFTKDTSTSF